MKILFLDGHGKFNMSDALRIETFLTQLGSEHHYVIASFEPGMVQAMLTPKFHVQAFDASRSFMEFLKHLLLCDLVFYGGCTLRQSASSEHASYPVAWLWKMLVVIIFARVIFRKKVVMSNIGIGPLTTPTERRVVRWILSQANFVSVRDEASHRTALKLGLSPLGLYLVPDVVFANSLEKFPSNPEALSPSNSTRIALHLNDDVEYRDRHAAFMRNLAEALNQIHADTPVEIHALNTKDNLISLTECTSQLSHIPVVFHEAQSAQEVAKVIAAVDVVLTEHFHSLVLSSILGKPFLGLIGNFAIRELVDYLDMDAHSVDINSPHPVNELTRKIRSVFADHENIAAHLTERSALLRMKLDRYFTILKAVILP